MKMQVIVQHNELKYTVRWKHSVPWLDNTLLPLMILYTSIDQGEDTGKHVAKKASTTSVFILDLKPTGYIYPCQI